MIAFADAVGSWLRLLAVIGLIAVRGIRDELRAQRAETAMFFRWARDIVRDELRWVLQEKLRLLTNRDPSRRRPR